MVKGDKIIDLKNNSVHIIESIDDYESITLVFTDDKKYIPISNVMEFNLYLNIIVDKYADTVADGLEKIRKEVNRKFERQRAIDSFFTSVKNLFKIKKIFK